MNWSAADFTPKLLSCVAPPHVHADAPPRPPPNAPRMPLIHVAANLCAAILAIMFKTEFPKSCSTDFALFVPLINAAMESAIVLYMVSDTSAIYSIILPWAVCHSFTYSFARAFSPCKFREASPRFSPSDFDKFPLALRCDVPMYCTSMARFPSSTR